MTQFFHGMASMLPVLLCSHTHHLLSSKPRFLNYTFCNIRAGDVGKYSIHESRLFAVPIQWSKSLPPE